MSGIFYGIGLGPGDPELLTIKAVNMIKQCQVLAVPGKKPVETVAYKIACKAVPGIEEKIILPLQVPMTKDRKAMALKHIDNARLIEGYLNDDKDVAYLTIGDPCIYSSFSYLQKCIEEAGYKTRIINGITSFCSVAATLNIPLAEWDEKVCILPGNETADIEKILTEGSDTTYIIMKSASHINEIKQQLLCSDRNIYAVENCGMENEKIYYGAENIPDEAGYYTLIIVR